MRAVHEQEAHIIAQAGVPGAVTIATNMAGRGTDIQLGGAIRTCGCSKIGWPNEEKGNGKEPTPNDLPPGAKRSRRTSPRSSRRWMPRLTSSAPNATKAGASTTVRGRWGPRAIRPLALLAVALEDDLMRILVANAWTALLQALGLKEDEAIIVWINKALEKAQAKVEARNFDIRKNLLKYDNVMNNQPTMFEQRSSFMTDADLGETIGDMRRQVIDDLIEKHIRENPSSSGGTSPV